MNVLRTYILIVSLFFVLDNRTQSQTLIDLKEPLTQENYLKWEAYVKQFAPADSAYKVVINIANRHYFSGRAAVSAGVFRHFKPYFPDKDSLMQRQIEIFEEVMLTQVPTYDMQGLYQEYINRNAPNENSFIALQRLAEPYINRRDWDSSAYIYRTFKVLFPEDSLKFDKIIDLIEKPERKIKVRNLGDSINTSGNEWDPTPTHDGRFLYFSASPRGGGKGNSDIWYSKLDSNGNWAKSKNLGAPINGRNDETIDNISADGNTVLLSGNFAGTYGNFDIYYADKTKDSWSNLQHFPMPINSKSTDEGGNLTADGKALLFTSDREGAIGEFRPFMSLGFGSRNGNMDIYVCERREDGSWGKAINLGETINTPLSERSPYLHPDGKTLYFSSEGHYGLGRLDVFMSKRLSDSSWTEWSEPVNLGKEINSAGEDWGYVVSLKGDSAYFAGFDRIDGYGGWDLYSVSVPEEYKPEEVVTISGFVRSSDGWGIAANIIWEDLETGEKVGQLRSDPNDGFYIIALKKDRNYGYFAERRGFYPSSDNIDLRGKITHNEITNDITLISDKEIKSGEKVVINNIFFDYDKFELKSESIPELKRLILYLERNRRLKVKIEGHTDSTGGEEHNLELSENRAKSVAEYLIENGIKRTRIETEGFGNKKPISDNSTEIGRRKNRRVEISFIE